MLLSACLTAAGVFWLHHEEERDWLNRFRQRAETLGPLFDLRCNNAAADLASIQVLFENSDWVSSAEFEHAARFLIARDQDLAAIEWIPVVPGHDRARFEQEFRAQGFTDFTIHTSAPGVDAPTASEYWPVSYITPLAPNRAAHGFDLRHGPTTASLAHARATRGLALSAPLRLVQASDSRTSVIFILPVFRRQDNLFIGWVQSIVHASELLRVASTEAQRLGLLLAVEAIDPTTGAAQPLHSAPGLASAAGRPHHCAEQDHGGRRWRMSVWPDSALLAQRHTLRPWLALLAGGFTTLLLALFIRTTSRRAREIETLVDLRTRELTSANQALSNEIAHRRRAEESAARDLLILASVRDAIIVAENAGRITFWNTGAETLYGRTAAEMLGQPILARFATEHPAKAQEVFASVAGGHDWSGELSECGKDGAALRVHVNLRRFLDAHGRPAGTIALAYDVTRLRLEQEAALAVERRLRDAQKLESLGVLAGGIAHDFNNLLTTMLGQASLLRLDLPASSPMQDSLASIETAATRAADLCQQMLAYSGCARSALRHLDLGALVEETARLARASLGRDARLVLELTPGLPPVYGDSIQLRQIVMNLVINSSDALGDRPGTITVTTGLIHADRPLLDTSLLGAGLPAADYCLLEVADTGCGMTPETLAHIFEPFYTTKFTGRGLGLSAVLGIVRSHHGTLQVESAPGQGSRFRLLLPAARRLHHSGPAEAPRPGPPTVSRPRILVVDDEPSVRETARQVLQAGGHEVELAADGLSALETFRRAPHLYAVVLLDYAMPRLDGPQTLAELRRLAPTLPVVLMSGFSEEEAFARFGPHGPATFLQKPFPAAALLELVRHHLSAAPTTG